MKRMLMFLVCSTLIFTATPGFSSERNLTPIEEATVSDYDYIVDCFDDNFGTALDFNCLEASTVANGLYLVRGNDTGLASILFFHIYKRCAHPYLNEWKDKRDHLANGHNQTKTSHGGVILKISLE